jgi:hypothetical protein
MQPAPLIAQEALEAFGHYLGLREDTGKQSPPRFLRSIGGQVLAERTLCLGRVEANGKA